MRPSACAAALAPPSAFGRDVQVAVLLLEPILLEPLLRVAQGRSRLEIELPHVLHAGQGGAVVDTLLEGDGLVRAHGLAGHEGIAGVDHEDVDAIHRELLHAVGGDLGARAHALPRGRASSRAGPGGPAFRGALDVLIAHLVRSRHAGSVAKPLDGPAPQDVRGQDLLEVGLLDPAIPDVVGIDHDHGAVTALREAAGLVDAYGTLLARLTSSVSEDLHETLGVALGRAGLTARADEHVTLVLAHRRSFG